MFCDAAVIGAAFFLRIPLNLFVIHVFDEVTKAIDAIIKA